MRVRMKTTMAGPNGCAWPGDMVEVTDEAAAQLVHGGYADPVDPPAEPEPKPAAEPAVKAIKEPVTKSGKRGR